MGLDIIAMSNMVKVENPESDPNWDAEFEYLSDGYKAYHLRGMERSFSGLEEDAWYRMTEDSDIVEFRAGSYGGYNEWRNALALLGAGIRADEMWADPDKYQDYPFFLLINFADNEGSIGPNAASLLDMQFAVGRTEIDQKARAHFTDDHEYEWFMDKYDDWAEAFKLARENGMVYFC